MCPRNPLAAAPALVALAAAAAAQPPAGEPPMDLRFVDVAEEAGVTWVNLCGGPVKDYIVEVNGNGAALADFDRDGDLDLVLVNGSTLERLAEGGDPMAGYYRNEGGLAFVDRTEASGLAARGWGMGACVGDADGDGLDDLYVTAWGPNHLYRSRGDGSFEDVTERAGVGDAGWASGCGFGDYDRDGDLDLYVTNYLYFDRDGVPPRGDSHRCTYLGSPVFCGPAGLPGQHDRFYRNRGDGTFDDVTAQAGVELEPRYAFASVFSDLDLDGWPDLYVANDSQPNYFFHNRRDGTFEETALLSGAALSGTAGPQASMGADTGDYDGDGDYDVFLTNFSQDHNTLYRNEGRGLFTDATFLAGLGGPSLRYLAWGTGFVDLDHDADLDLFVANGHIFHDVGEFGVGSTYAEPNQVFQNLGNGRFRDASAELGDDLVREKSSRGAPWGDLDHDGDLDILIVELNERPTLLRNDGGSRRRFLILDLVGVAGNPAAYGARVAVEAAGKVQVLESKSGEGYLSHSDSRLHFGLRDDDSAERVEIRWPLGGGVALLDLPADRFYRVPERRPAPGARPTRSPVRALPGSRSGS